MKTLAEVVYQCRQHAGITLAELAEKIGGVTRQALGHYETGEKFPPPNRLEQIAKVCRVSITVSPRGWSWKPMK